MCTVVLCTIPTPATGAEHALLDRIGRLITRGKGSFLFAGIGGEAPGSVWTVALRLPGHASASDVGDAWRDDPTLPTAIRMTVLRLL